LASPSDLLPERSFLVEPFAFCDSRPATAAGHGRAFTLLVLLVLMATIGATAAPPTWTQLPRGCRAC
jgi:hypothetical protein